MYILGDVRYVEGFVYFDGFIDECCIYINCICISYFCGLERFRDIFFVVLIVNINLSENWGFMGLMRLESNIFEVSCNFGDFLVKMEEFFRLVMVGMVIEVVVIVMLMIVYIIGS